MPAPALVDGREGGMAKPVGSGSPLPEPVEAKSRSKLLVTMSHMVLLSLQRVPPPPPRQGS